MQKYNFTKLLDARHKAHLKRTNYLDKYDFLSANKLGNKIDKLSQIIINEIDNI